MYVQGDAQLHNVPRSLTARGASQAEKQPIVILCRRRPEAGTYAMHFTLHTWFHVKHSLYAL